MARFKLTNGGQFITVQHKGETVNFAEGDILDTDDAELARELYRWKYVELQGDLPKEKEAPEPAPPITEDLQELSRKELQAKARSLGITIKSKMNKKMLREAIESARE